MKNLRMLFSVCLGVFAFGTSGAVDMDDVARAAARHDTSNFGNMSSTRNVIASTQKASTTTPRTTPTTPRTTTTVSRTNISNKSVATRATSATATRAQSNVIPRNNIAQRPVTNTSRTTTTRSTAQTATRTTPRTTATTARRARTTARAATTSESGALVTNYTRCREIYYECMDEFCANKDANLRRCACSSRATEFKNTQKQLSTFEDKMLDFNQRLLLVNMDAEDVDAINKSTEGEDAFYGTKDRTKSKRTLDEISKKLNTSFDSSTSDTFSLAPISLSLNADAAFDSIDSFGGIDTTTKSGTALYSSAMPICRDVALEVCTEDELSLAASGYQMMIEQDCNTVFKSYQSQVNQARSKVFESNALLDISRLDAYQTRNSDDMLTCKRKMLEMLTDTTVCGTNLEKCLDMTGKYIDPTTGTAFLTENLADLGELITRPAANQTWTLANANGKFINYLKNRKHYLEPAMENCQSIADSVWDAFIEDALAQIKLAQLAKLEEIRQACTTLTSECMDSAIDSINEFDARALSIFGVGADRMANAMCSDVKKACTALIDSSGDTLWEVGISDITTTKTYDAIVSSCTQVGRNCIIQSCKSISGNFDLCNDIDLSPNRHAILERTACWPEVLACVGAAGDDALLAIIDSFNLRPNGDHKYAFYKQMYSLINPNPIDDICETVCTAANAECAKCRIAESIWGNCEEKPSLTIKTDENDINKHNRILEPTASSEPSTSLLWWFAENTYTDSDDRSCVNVRCDSDQIHYTADGQKVCVPEEYLHFVTDDNLYCPVPYNQMEIFETPTGQQPATNCCFNGSDYWHHEFIGTDTDGICCETGNTETIDNNKKICLPSDIEHGITIFKHSSGAYLVCMGPNQLEDLEHTNDFPAGKKIGCTMVSDARFVLISPDNKYITPSGDSVTQYTPRMVYYPIGDNSHSNPQTDTTDAQTGFIRYGGQ